MEAGDTLTCPINSTIIKLFFFLTSHHLEESMVRPRELNINNEWISVVQGLEQMSVSPHPLALTTQLTIAYLLLSEPAFLYLPARQVGSASKLTPPEQPSTNDG